MKQYRLTSAFSLTTLTLAIFPLLLLIAFFGYVVEARLHLGHWPSYGNPDPKELGWWIQHSILQLGFIGFPGVVFTATGLAVLGRVRSRKFPFLTVIATIVVTSAAFITFVRIDPGGFVDWFLD